jgi:hypothetical protein
MTIVPEAEAAATAATYELEGSLLEVCTCNTLCPCWVGEDPDGGTCDGLFAWHIDKGHVNGTDVSGRTFGFVAHIPGNVLDGNWQIVVFLDDGASEEQQQALLDVWTGKLGGPVADLAQLVGEVRGMERVPVTFEVEGVKGTMKYGEYATARLEPFKGATGESTALHDTIFTTIPGSPAYVGKSEHYRVDMAEYGFQIDLRDHNAVQGSFRFKA